MIPDEGANMKTGLIITGLQRGHHFEKIVQSMTVPWNHQLHLFGP
jgi:hypothetical protein